MTPGRPSGNRYCGTCLSSQPFLPWEGGLLCSVCTRLWHDANPGRASSSRLPASQAAAISAVSPSRASTARSG